MSNSEILTCRDVAQRLDLSVERIRQLDSELHPVRLTNGVRLYLARSIEEYATQREARRDAR